jgi:predicted dehydrogenase
VTHKEKRLLRLGILGCGPIAQAAHFDACHKARNAELYALCDHAEDLRTAMAARHQPHAVYTDFNTMLADPQVDAVLIAVADQFHASLALQALDAGKHVFVEKPLGVNVEECQTLQSRLQQTDRVLQIGHNKRFDPGIAFARDFVQTDLGALVALKAWYHDSHYRYAMTDNLQPSIQQSAQATRPDGNPKADRRRYLMLGHGSHLVDTARFLGGEITAVQARLVERSKDYCWFIGVEFANGAVGHLDLAVAISGDWDEGFTVFGETGSVKGKTYLPWFHKTSEVECFSAKDRQIRRPLGEDAFTYKLQLEGFADTILQGSPQQGAGIDDGVASVKAMAAIARSVESSQWVRLDSVTGAI